MIDDRDDEESDERDEDGTVARPVFRLLVSATLMGVVLGELGCDWANFLWAWSRGLRRRKAESTGCTEIKTLSHTDVNSSLGSVLQ